jgi:class 3 adenylate cyclase
MNSPKTETAHVLMTDRVGYSQISIERKSRLDKELLDAVLCGPASGLTETQCIRLDSGDGVALVFFGEPLLAIEAALHLHATVAKSAAVKLRIGLHSGLVTRRRDANNKSNVSGPGIDKAQRAMSCADGSQVVMTEFFAENLRAFEGWGERLIDLGEHPIKHAETLRLYSIKPVAIAETKQGEVVLLYRRQAKPDDQVLALLEERLPELGYSVFIDRHLKIGVAWAQSIEERIREADFVIALISESAQSSEMLEAELEIAYEQRLAKGKPKILPIRIGQDEPVQGPLAAYLSSLQYGLWFGPKDDDTLLASVKSALIEMPPAIEPIEADTGGLAPDSQLYIERSADASFHQSLQARESILLVKGPRQIGKTSLLARGIHSGPTTGARCAFTDFQKYGTSLMSTEDAFYRALARSVSKQIGFTYDFAGQWDADFGSTVNLEEFICAALEAEPTPLIWFIDEADKLFGSPFASDFFGLVRSWHNSRATNFAGPWKRLTVVIAYATEAHLFIQDLNQSPFNVGRRFDLEEFDAHQVATLNVRSGSPLNGDREIETLMALVGGQPFLVRRALSVLRSGTSFSDLLKKADRSDGPFGDHLKRVLISVSKLEPVLAAVRSLLEGSPVADQDALYRLLSAGIIVQSDSGCQEFRNGLYKRYLAEHCAESKL